MSPEQVQLLVSLGGLLLGAVGLPLLYLQLRDVKRSIRASTHAAMYDQAAGFRGYLIEHPHLRRYFFDNEPIEPDHQDYARVVTIAELYLNYLEHIAVMGDSFGRENRPALERFSKKAFEGSPILRQHLALHRASYSDALRG